MPRASAAVAALCALCCERAGGIPAVVPAAEATCDGPAPGVSLMQQTRLAGATQLQELAETAELRQPDVGGLELLQLGQESSHDASGTMLGELLQRAEEQPAKILAALADAADPETPAGGASADTPPDDAPPADAPPADAPPAESPPADAPAADEPPSHSAPAQPPAPPPAIDNSQPPAQIAPFGREDTAQELQSHAARTQDTLVDAVENAEVAEIKRSVFRALTRLRAAEIKEFDTIARLETQAIDEYNDDHHYRVENPLEHLASAEPPVPEDKFSSFHD